MKILSQSKAYSAWRTHPYANWAGGIEAAYKTPQAPLSSLPEVTRLKRGLEATRFIGRRVFVVDIGARALNVATSDRPLYQFGKELVGFGAGAAGMWATYSAIIKGTSVLVVATPYGWIAVVLAMAAGAAAAYYSDKFAQLQYDNVIKSTKALLD